MTTKYKIFTIEELIGDRNRINSELQSKFPQVDIVIPGMLQVMPDYLRALAQRVAEGTTENRYIAYSPRKLIVPNKQEVLLYEKDDIQSANKIITPLNFTMTAEIEKAGFLKISDIDEEMNNLFGYQNMIVAAKIYAIGMNSTQELNPEGCLSIIYLKNMKVEPLKIVKK